MINNIVFDEKTSNFTPADICFVMDVLKGAQENENINIDKNEIILSFQNTLENYQNNVDLAKKIPQTLSENNLQTAKKIGYTKVVFSYLEAVLQTISLAKNINQDSLDVLKNDTTEILVGNKSYKLIDNTKIGLEVAIYLENILKTIATKEAAIEQIYLQCYYLAFVLLEKNADYNNLAKNRVQDFEKEKEALADEIFIGSSYLKVCKLFYFFFQKRKI